MIRTLTFNLDFNDNNKKIILELLSISSSIFNYYVNWALTNKTYNKNKCHKETYKIVKNEYPTIPTGLIQSIRDISLESIKATKFKRKPKKKKYSSIRFDKRTISLRGKMLTFSCIGKRQKSYLKVPKYYENIFNNWKFTGGTIRYDSKKDKIIANLQFKTEAPKLLNQNKVIGIDRGLYNIVSLSNGKIINSKEIRKQQRKYLYNRKKLQAKGTPSAKKKLKKLSGKEMRFSKNFNHCISKYIVSLDFDIFALEDLKNIRKQSKKSKKLNKWISSWPFFQLEQFLQYKAESLGKQVIKVDPRYTSQKCSCCGYIEKSNRNKSNFHCVNCGFKEHADINAAINIKNNYILSSTEKSLEQVAVNQ